eukprot:4756510-Amphidinium_carterae.1
MANGSLYPEIAERQSGYSSAYPFTNCTASGAMTMTNAPLLSYPHLYCSRPLLAPNLAEGIALTFRRHRALGPHMLLSTLAMPPAPSTSSVDRELRLMS